MYGQIDFTKLKPANYNRKSSEDEDRQVLSVSSQMDEAKRISDFYQLPPFVETFQESKSAKTEYCRPEFIRMVGMIKQGVIDAIVCWKLDRLARNMTEGGMLIDLISSGVLKAIITHDKVYYPTDNVLLMSVEFGQGKQFVKDLAVNVKRGQRKKASMGIPHGIASLGFLNDRTEEKGNRSWKVDEDRFWKIRKLFEVFLTGNYSAGKLHQYAVEEMKLDTIKRKKIGGKIIGLSRIYQILKDPIYAGFFYYGNERFELDKNLPRILTEGQYEKAQQLLSKRNIPKFQHHEALYSGFIRSDDGDFIGQDIKFQVICDCKYKFAYRDKTHCPSCGKEIDQLQHPKYLIHSYYYNNRKKKAKLSYKSINESVIDEEIKNYFTNNLSFSNDMLNWSRKHIHEMRDREVDENILVSKDKEKRKVDFEMKKRRLREMLRDEKVTDAEYAEDLKLLKSEYSDTDTVTAKDDWYKDMMEITDITEKINDVMADGTFQSKRLILSELGSNLVWNDEKLSIYSKESITILIDGIKRLKSEFPKFEPKTYVGIQGLNEKNEPLDPIFSALLPR